MIDLLPLLVVLGTSVWVLIDSRTIGVEKGQTKGFFNMGPAGWFFSCLLCWIVAFPAYLVKRPGYKRVNAPGRLVGGSHEVDLMSDLGTLADLYSQGLLTEVEFQAKKKELVHRMLEQ
jgi:Short C-terminal domain